MTLTRPSLNAGRSARRSSPRQPEQIVPVIVAGVALVLLGLRVELQRDITAGTILALALLPCWLPSLKRYAGARLIFGVGLVAMASGVLLTEFSSGDHSTSSTLLTGQTMIMVELLTGMGVVLWAREQMPDTWVATLFGVGLLIGVSPGSALFASNPWKFGFSTGATVIVLALVGRFHRRWLELVGLLLFAAISATTDARSSFAILLVAAVLVLWQLRSRERSRRSSTARFVVGFAVIGFVIYNVGQTLLVNGYLGDGAESRSVAQIDTSGSLIVGGRPEIAATVALMAHHFAGFGSGVLPSLSDITVAKTGMQAIGYQPNNGYVENYMFGTQFELHSVFGDLWADFGVAGLIFVVVIVAVAVTSLSRRIALGTAGAVVLYLAVRGLWNLAFGPFYGSSILLIPMLGLLLVYRSREVEKADPPRRGLPDSVAFAQYV